jgi:deoxyribonuclease IV
MLMLRIGYHLSIAGSLDLAFDRAYEIGCTAMQIFVTNPRSWELRPLESEEAANFIKKSKQFDIRPVCVHMPYLPNLASSETPITEKSIKSLKDNINLCNQLGIRYLVTHMGSHKGKGKEVGLKNVINALASVSDSIGNVTVLLENQAGHLNSIGAKVEDLLYVYDNSPLKKGSLGFCLDTCHLFAAGYDVRSEKALDDINDILGFEKVHAMHFNDAMFELGSGKDRHDNIGQGQIGLKGFRTMLKYRDIAKKALILETPENPLLEEGEELRTILKIAEGN